MKTPSLKSLLPEYPATRHLPWKPNTKGDHIADESEAAVVFGSRCMVQEKIDGANCGMALVDGHPVIRNRTKLLRKGDLSKNLNPSLAQFAAAFTWFYKNLEKFEKIVNLAGPVTVYGEWMVQQHGMKYDLLPDWFVAFDLYDQEKGNYIDPFTGMDMLARAGFSVIPGELSSPVESYEQLEEIANRPSRYASGEKREGIYVKVSDGKWVTDRFKMVREGFQQGCLLGDEIKRNQIGATE